MRFLVRFIEQSSRHNWLPPILYSLLPAIPILIGAWSNLDRINDKLRSGFTWNTQEDTYDFIVVGGGTAGSVLANRLSQDHDVILLEAGGEPFPFSAVPLFSLPLSKYSQIDWNYKTVPQIQASLASPNHQGSWSSGKGLGGSSNLGYLLHARGNPSDFDEWGNLTGDPGWAYDGLLPYFRKSENFFGEYEFDDVHGHGGEVTVQVPSYIGLAEAFVRAALELGYSKRDLNGRWGTDAFDVIYSPIKRGKRHGSYAAYIKPIRKRLTLKISKFSHVTRVLFNNEKRAVGVEYERHGRKRFAFAKKEVILSAGAIATPKILMLSGIGPKRHLQDCRIECISDLPVGENLQDHVSVFLGPFFIQRQQSFMLGRDVEPKSMVEYLTSGKGPFTSAGYHATGFVSSSKSSIPNLQLSIFGHGGFEKFEEIFAQGFGLNKDLLKNYYASTKGKDSFHIVVTLARPQQRGIVTLGRLDPQLYPVIDPKYLQNHEDVRVLVEGIKLGLNLVENTTSFNKFLEAELSREKFPGCESFTHRSDLYWECYVRHLIVSMGDYVGTASLGEVLDSECRVRGVKGLRVADASLIPSIPISGVNPSVLMIAEKAAHFLKQKWKFKPHNEL